MSLLYSRSDGSDKRSDKVGAWLYLLQLTRTHGSLSFRTIVDEETGRGEAARSKVSPDRLGRFGVRTSGCLRVIAGLRTVSP